MLPIQIQPKRKKVYKKEKESKKKKGKKRKGMKDEKERLNNIK